MTGQQRALILYVFSKIFYSLGSSVKIWHGRKRERGERRRQKPRRALASLLPRLSSALPDIDWLKKGEQTIKYDVVM